MQSQFAFGVSLQITIIIKTTKLVMAIYNLYVITTEKLQQVLQKYDNLLITICDKSVTKMQQASCITNFPGQIQNMETC